MYVSYFERRETEVPGEAPFGAKKRTQHKLNLRLRNFEPGSHRWDASALPTAQHMQPPKAQKNGLLAFMTETNICTVIGIKLKVEFLPPK